MLCFFHSMDYTEHFDKLSISKISSFLFIFHRTTFNFEIQKLQEVRRNQTIKSWFKIFIPSFKTLFDIINYKVLNITFELGQFSRNNKIYELAFQKYQTETVFFCKNSETKVKHFLVIPNYILLKYFKICIHENLTIKNCIYYFM